MATLIGRRLLAAALGRVRGGKRGQRGGKEAAASLLLRCCVRRLPLGLATNVPFPAWPYRYFGFSGASGTTIGTQISERGRRDDGPPPGKGSGLFRLSM